MRSLFAIAGLFLLCEPAMADGTITVTPFIAYYGEGSPKITGAKIDSPIALPNHLGDSSTDVDAGAQKICGAGNKYYINSIGQSGGGGHGYNVFAGVCIKESK